MTEESTARRREMGWTARALRSGTHLSAQALAHRVGVLPSKVSRWENGLREMTAHDMALYMGACGVDEAERKRLLELSRPPSDLYWVRPHFTRNTDALKSVIVQESLANRLVGYEPLVVPGLYQTEAYARAMLEWRGPAAAAWIDLQMKALRDRQQVLRTPSTPQGTFYLHERALRTVVGGPRIMHEQLLLLVLSS